MHMVVYYTVIFILHLCIAGLVSGQVAPMRKSIKQGQEVWGTHLR